jgi:hypothetical protein
MQNPKNEHSELIVRTGQIGGDEVFDPGKHLKAIDRWRFSLAFSQTSTMGNDRGHGWLRLYGTRWTGRIHGRNRSNAGLFPGGAAEVKVT